MQRRFQQRPAGGLHVVDDDAQQAALGDGGFCPAFGGQPGAPLGQGHLLPVFHLQLEGRQGIALQQLVLVGFDDQPALVDDAHRVAHPLHVREDVGGHEDRALAAQALDQRGHGETEWADSYTLNSALGDLEAFVSALDVKSFVLLGHSMGGWISYMYAPSHPAQVVRLIIVDMGPEIMPAFAQRLSSSLDAGDVFENHEHVLRKMRAENSRASDEELFHRAKHNVHQRQDGKWTWRYDRGFRDGSRPIERLAPAQQWQALARITCPTLLVRGAETDLLARETALRMVSTIPNCRYVEIPHAGHSVFMDNPTDFIAAVEKFLSADS